MKQTARAKRLARQASSPVTPESLGLDATLYADAIRYLFDRPVPGKKEREWYWDMDGPCFEATALQWTHIQTVLFANAGTDLAPFNDEQVGMGLNCVMSTNAGDIPLQVLDPSVPLADAVRMLQAFPRLWSDCIGPRRARVHEAIGTSSGRLGFVCYMWFDVWPTFWNARHIPEWRDAMWQLFCQMLKVPCRDVQVSALHGIGHEGRALLRPSELQERVGQFICGVPAHDEELKNYAHAAAQGMVQ